MEKPLGIKIIAVLSAIGGVLAVIGGVGLLSVSSAIDTASSFLKNYGAASPSYPLFGASVWALILIVLGIVNIAGAYGAWNLKKWAWSLLVSVMVFGIVQNLLFLGVSGASAFIGITIDGVVLYYLYQVKESFNQ